MGQSVPLSRRGLLAGGAAAALARPAIAADTDKRVLKFVPQASLTVLDPIVTNASVTNAHAYHVFDTLYGLDRTMRPRPQMAAGHQVSDDGLVYVITLRDGLRFHDGEPVLARDCVASVKRWSQRDTLGRLLAASVEEWQAPSDKQIRIRLKRPFPQLIGALAKPTAAGAFMMPERLAATDPAKQIPEVVGSGPYQFLPGEFVIGAQAAYRRFDRYVPRDEPPEWFSGGKVAHFERVEWHILPDQATAAAALLSGEIDWWEQAFADLVPLLKRNKDVVTEISDPNGYIGILRFNHLYPPFNNAAVRRAVFLGINQPDYMSAVTGNDPETWRACHSVFPCGTRYGQASSPDPVPEKGDPDRARAALREAGYGGEKVVLLNPSDFPTIAPFGLLTHDLLKRMGMNVELVETDWGSVTTRITNRAPIASGGWSLYHAWTSGLSISTPPINGPIRGLPGAGWPGWYESAPMEALTREWLDATKDLDRDRVAMEMQNLALSDLPSIPLGQFFIRTAYRRSLTGVLQAPRPLPWNVRRA